MWTERPGRRAGSAGPDLGTLVPLALALIAEDQAGLERFFALTGLSAANLRQVAAEPGFADAVMGYICDDDKLIVALAARAKCRPEAIVAAAGSRAALDAARDHTRSNETNEPG